MSKTTDPKAKKLAQAATDFTPEVMGTRCATFLGEQYEYPRTKKIARDLGIAPATAKALLNGKPPSTSQIAALTRKFGASFHTFVFGPAIGWHGDADMRRQLDDLMRSADELRRRIDARSNTE